MAPVARLHQHSTRSIAGIWFFIVRRRQGVCKVESANFGCIGMLIELINFV